MIHFSKKNRQIYLFPIIFLLCFIVNSPIIIAQGNGVINFKGDIADLENNRAVDYATVQIFLKGGRMIHQKQVSNAFNFELPPALLIDAKRLELVIIHPDYQRYRRTIKIPSSGNIKAKDIRLRTKTVKVNKVLPYLPYYGHFTRSNRDKVAGGLLVFGGMGSLFAGIYGRQKKIDFTESAASTANPYSKALYYDKASNHQTLSQYGWISLAGFSGLSILTNILQIDLDNRRYTFEFNSQKNDNSIVNLSLKINLN